MIKYPEKQKLEEDTVYLIKQVVIHHVEIQVKNSGKNLDASQAMVAQALIPALGKQSQADLWVQA